MFWMRKCMEEPTCSNFRIITAIYQCQIFFLTFTAPQLTIINCFQLIIKDQDEHLDKIGTSVGVLKNMSHQIGNELDEQNMWVYKQL